MRIYVTSLIILDYKYYIYHGSYELTYLNQRIREWVGLNRFMSKIHGIYGL